MAQQLNSKVAFQTQNEIGYQNPCVLDTLPARPFLWYHPMLSKTNVNKLFFQKKMALKNLAQNMQVQRIFLNSYLPHTSVLL